MLLHRSLIFIICTIALICSAFLLLKRYKRPLQLKRSFEWEWPFRKFCDKQNRVLNNIALLNGPFRSDAHRDMFVKLKTTGIIIVGASHYQEFPGPITNPSEDTYYRTHLKLRIVYIASYIVNRTCILLYIYSLHHTFKNLKKVLV